MRRSIGLANPLQVSCAPIRALLLASHVEARTPNGREKPNSDPAALVAAAHLTLSVAGRTLLVRAGLALSAGRKAALVGRNGSGKSTLLTTLAPTARRQGLLLWAEGWASLPAGDRSWTASRCRSTMTAGWRWSAPTEAASRRCSASWSAT